jgi:membrane protein DedA with SNARE-associated domain
MPMLAGVILRYGYALVFVAAAVEGDATLLTATFLAHRGYLQLHLVIVVAAAGTVAINQVYYWVARVYGRRRVATLRERPTAQRVLDRIDRHGTLLVLGSRFAYGFRIAIPAACGATGMSPIRFTAGDVAGAAAWSVVIGLTGFAIGHLLDRLVDDLRRYEWWIALVLFCGVLVALAWHGRDVFPLRTLRLAPRRDPRAR